MTYMKRSKKAKARAQAIDPNFDGLHSLVSYDGNKKIYHHAATITEATIAMGGTTPNKSARTWLYNIVNNSSRSNEKFDYGHIVANQSGGSGALNGLNGFVQNQHINRGTFKVFQMNINANVSSTNKASQFVTLEYKPGEDIANRVEYEVSYTNGDSDFKSFGN